MRKWVEISFSEIPTHAANDQIDFFLYLSSAPKFTVVCDMSWQEEQNEKTEKNSFHFSRKLKKGTTEWKVKVKLAFWKKIDRVR